MVVLFVLGWAFWHFSPPLVKKVFLAQILPPETTAYWQSSFTGLADVLARPDLPEELLLLKRAWFSNLPSLQDEGLYRFLGKSKLDQAVFFQLTKESPWQAAFEIAEISPEVLSQTTLNGVSKLSSSPGVSLYRLEAEPFLFAAFVSYPSAARQNPSDGSNGASETRFSAGGSYYLVLSPSLDSLKESLIYFQRSEGKTLAQEDAFQHLKRLSQGGDLLYLASLPFTYEGDSTLFASLDKLFDASGFVWQGREGQGLRFFLYGKDLVVTGSQPTLDLVSYLPEESVFYVGGADLDSLVKQLVGRSQSQPSFSGALLSSWLNFLKENFRLDLVSLLGELGQSNFAFNLMETDENSGRPSSFNLVLCSSSSLDGLARRIKDSLEGLPFFETSPQGRVLPDGTTTREIVEVPSGTYHWEKIVLEGCELNTLKSPRGREAEFSYALWGNYMIFSTDALSVLEWLRGIKKNQTTNLGSKVVNRLAPLLNENSLLFCWVGGKISSWPELDFSSFSWFSALRGGKNWEGIGLVPFNLGYEVKFF